MSGQLTGQWKMDQLTMYIYIYISYSENDVFKPAILVYHRVLRMLVKVRING